MISSNARPAFLAPPEGASIQLKQLDEAIRHNGYCLKDSSLQEHLSELRRRLLSYLAVVLAVFLVIVNYGAEALLVYIMTPVKAMGVNFIYLTLLDAFNSRIVVSMMAALILTFPIGIWQVYSFIKEGLYPGERKSTICIIAVSTVLFILGISFGYGIAFTSSVGFFLFNNDSLANTLLSVNMYVRCVFSFVIPFALAFEFPLLCYLLKYAGIISSDTLRGKRKIIIMAVLIISALITPPDVVSQLMLALPILLLYELSIRALDYV